MWLTVDGMRCLQGHEARLLCRAVASMLPECLAAGKGKRQHHSAGCRKRIEELLAGDEDGQRHLREAKDRTDHLIENKFKDGDAEPSSMKATNDR